MSRSELTYNDYDPGHPWYYKLGGPPLEAEKIGPREHVMRTEKSQWEFVAYDLVRSGERSDWEQLSLQKREKIISRQLKKEQQHLESDIERYNHVKDGTGRPVDLNGLTPKNEEERFLGWCSSMSLKNAHISFHRTRISILRRYLRELQSKKGYQNSLF